MLSSPFSAHNPFMHAHYKCKSRLEIAIKLQHLLHRSCPSPLPPSLSVSLTHTVLHVDLLFKNSNWTLALPHSAYFN